ncbi:DUF4435 domain-containing protein [Serratia fonticola]|uniref:DUF4435 domain-containing protein n=1 Tax=Serratia fonticola TaxID=47917 RepID=UPI003AAE9BEF
MERSTAAKKARSVFFENQNSIDIYIEDTAVGYKKIFKCLLNRVLSEKYLINDVFPLGGRGSVISEWEKDKNKRERPRLYIIDGDLHLLNGNHPREPGLYSLPFYCIENILISEHALTQLMVEEDPEREYEELKTSLNYTNWLVSNRMLMDLFIAYAITFKHCPSIPTVSCKIKEFISGNTGEIDERKVTLKIKELHEHVKNKIGMESFDNELRVLNPIKNENNALLKYVSAKDYLLPLLLLRLRENVKTTAQNINLKFRFSQVCEVDKISDIDNYILN